MKYRIFGMILAVACLLCACGGKTPANQTQPETPPEESAPAEVDYSIYYDLIDTITAGLTDGFTEEQKEELHIAPSYFLSDASFETPGYLITDLDGDGVDELLLGENGEDGWDSIIYDLYTIKDGEMVQVIEGWERNRYYLCENGAIANEGANSAFNSIYAYFDYANGELTLREAVEYNSERGSEAEPWFYSTAALWDEAGTPISQERADEVIAAYSYRTLEFRPFTEQ